jgi:hypothetical protein
VDCAGRTKRDEPRRRAIAHRRWKEEKSLDLSLVQIRRENVGAILCHSLLKTLADDPGKSRALDVSVGFVVFRRLTGEPAELAPLGGGQNPSQDIHFVLIRAGSVKQAPEPHHEALRVRGVEKADVLQG